MNNLIEKAIELLKKGEVIAAPTDTVYGLLADATNDVAVKKVFGLKKRPLTKPLIVLVDSIEMANEIATFSEDSEQFAKKVWLIEKRPVTLIFKAKNISKLITGGGNTVAIRLPNKQFCLDLIKGIKKPIVAPSANISNHPTAISAEMVKNDFGDKIPLIIDKGICQTSPSTIIDLTGARPLVIR